MGQVIIEITHASLKDWFLPLELLTRFIFTYKELNLLSRLQGPVCIRYTYDHTDREVVTNGAQGRH